MSDQLSTFPPTEQPLEAYILELEARLSKERASFAENAFGIGCRAIAVPVVLVAGVAFLLSRGGWVSFFLIAISAILLAFVLVSLFANQAQSNAARRIFHQEIEPALAACQERYQVSLDEIYARAAVILPPNAALRTFLDLPAPPASEAPASEPPGP